MRVRQKGVQTTSILAYVLVSIVLHTGMYGLILQLSPCINGETDKKIALDLSSRIVSYTETKPS